MWVMVSSVGKVKYLYEPKMASNFTNNDLNQIQNDILGDTKMVLHLMDESKERVINLKLILKELENKKEQLDNVKLEIKNSIITNTAQIEARNDFKSYMERCNEEFLKIAQLVYNQCQTLSLDLTLCHNECNKVEKILSCENDKFNETQKELEAKKINYFDGIQAIEKKIEGNKAKSVEKSRENINLKETLDTLEKDILIKEKYINEKIIHEQKISEQRKIIVDTDNNLEEAASILNNLENEKGLSQTSLTINIGQYDKLLEDKKMEIDSINYEENNDTLKKCIERKTELELSITNLNVALKENDHTKADVYQKIIDNTSLNEIKYEQLNNRIEEYEKAFFYQNHIAAELIIKINNQEVKMKDLESEIMNFTLYINNINEKPRINHQEEINSKKSLLDDLKVKRGMLKEELNNKRQNIDTERNNIKKIIEDLQIGLTKPQGDYEQGELEVKRLAANKDYLIQEIQNKEKEVKEWEGKKETIEKKLQVIKEDALKVSKLQRKSIAPLRQPLIQTRSANSRNFWDSDSSIEAIDLASKMKNKKMRKLEQNKIKN